MSNSALPQDNQMHHSDSSKSKTGKKTKNKILIGTLAVCIGVIGLGGAGLAYRQTTRYKVSDAMEVNLKELTNTQYPANTSGLSKKFRRYNDRTLTVVKRDDNHFDFVLEPNNDHTAKIVIKNIDLELLTPKVPEWTKNDEGLEVVAFTNREWNRQQISFPADSEHIEISGGDGFEEENIYQIALANNCINGGLWEVILTTKEDGNKKLYYQGWFDFPHGLYKEVFEDINNISYWKHWRRLEHWQDPSGAVVKTDLLRDVIDEQEVQADFPLDEKIIASGEQVRKVRTVLANNLQTWGDFYSGEHEIKFGSFVPPGYYNTDKPWGHEYWRIGQFDKAVLRNINPVGVDETLQELELTFTDTKSGEQNKLFISGVDIKNLPQLPVEEYNKGLYMPLGIGIPPFYQDYEELKTNHPDKSPYFAGLLDSKGGWINNHQVALAGVAMHRDQENSDLLHLYFLSYERMTLIAHFKVDIKSLY